jgi:hypothetical protein
VAFALISADIEVGLYEALSDRDSRVPGRGVQEPGSRVQREQLLTAVVEHGPSHRMNARVPYFHITRDPTVNAS